MRSNKGVTLITLIVTIIVMIILSAITIRVATSGIDSTTEARITNEKKELETAIIQRFADHANNEIGFPLLGDTVTLSDIAEYGTFESKDLDYIRKVGQSHIRGLGVKNPTGNLYYVDYFTGKVYGPINRGGN